MFIENVFRGKNDIGRWIAMIVILIIAIEVIGFFPLGFKIFLNSYINPDLMSDPDNPLDVTAYDISPVTGLTLLIIPFVIGFIALLLLIKPLHERPVLSLFTGSSSFRWKRFLWGFGIWLILISAYSLITFATGLQKFDLHYDPGNFLSLALVSVLLLPFQAGFEETFFRGYLLQGFVRIFQNRWAPLILTALLFGGFHYLNPVADAFGIQITVSKYIWFGLFFGLCTLMDDGIELALGIHTVNSIFMTMLFTRESTVIQTPALFNITGYSPMIELVGLIILSLLFIFIAKRRFTWPGWNLLLAKVENPVKEEEEFEGYPAYDEYEEDEEDID